MSDICTVYDCNEEAPDDCAVTNRVFDMGNKEFVDRDYKLCPEHHRLFTSGRVVEAERTEGDPLG